MIELMQVKKLLGARRLTIVARRALGRQLAARTEEEAVHAGADDLAVAPRAFIIEHAYRRSA